MDEVEIVVAHGERTTLRVGDVFLKVDADQARIDREVAAMALAPVPVPRVLWRQPPVLALGAVRGTPLARLGTPSTASSSAWAAAGAMLRTLHDAPLPDWSGPSTAALRTRLGTECAALVSGGLLPAGLVARNRELAEAALAPRPAVFVHGDLQPAHVLLDGDEVVGVLDWSEGAQGDPLADLATLTLGYAERLPDVLAGYGRQVDVDGVRGWWSLRSLVATRWLLDHGFDPFAPGCEVDVLRAALPDAR
jgi:aminoglycoside phosphotransferase (APT) family kinase protein